MSVKAKQHVDCACTKIQQDETCPVGYPSLLCESCDGKGVVPYVKMDGPELWEIVFGIANEVAHEITDEQYTKIAEAINSVFIDPAIPVSAPSPRAQMTRAEKAEADNAALTARVKELEAERDTADRALHEQVMTSNETLAALETQLAAMKKALEFISGIGFVAAKDAPAHHDEAVKVARAALEVRP